MLDRKRGRYEIRKPRCHQCDYLSSDERDDDGVHAHDRGRSGHRNDALPPMSENQDRFLIYR